ncbi:MAG: PrsW family glutamic-type intramembrane protease, partial [Candidatus Eiseniibacteriota bacterium]
GCYFANTFLLDSGAISPAVLTLYLAPALEEFAKALYLFLLIRSHRVGFMVDAGIIGFAIGTGFAILENFYYAGTIGASSLLIWLVRGLGTAIMHGSATAVVGIITKNLVDRNPKGHWYLYLPGLALAIFAHSTFNHLSHNPLLATAFLLVVMPLLLFLVFEYSERATREWLGSGLDLDMELLEQINSGEVMETRVGGYLHSLKEHFPGEMVADMLCLVRIQLELSTRAKGLLLARAAGLDLPLDETVRENFEELKFLEKSIGPTGRMAILPFLRTSSRDLWQFYRLGK